MGRQEFRYALLPHAGTFQEAGIVREALQFNNPLFVAAAVVSVSSDELSAEEKVQQFQEAVDLSAETGKGVIVRF